MKLVETSQYPNTYEINSFNNIDFNQFETPGVYFFISPTGIKKLIVSEINQVLLPYKGDLSKFYKNVYGEEPQYATDNAYLLSTNKNLKISAMNMAKVMRFFRDVYDKHQSESAFLLLVNTVTKDIAPLFVVNYDISGGSVHYIQPTTNQNNHRVESLLKEKNVSEMHEKVVSQYNELYNQGYRIYGTIHSHCNFGAFHSGVDEADEKIFDGLHITVGNVRSSWSYAQRWMINGFSWKIEDINSLLDAPIKDVEALVDTIETPEEIMAMAMKEERWHNNKSHDTFHSAGHSKRWDPRLKRWVPTSEWGRGPNQTIFDDEDFQSVANMLQGGGGKAQPIKKNSNSEKIDIDDDDETAGFTIKDGVVTADMAELAAEFTDDLWSEDDFVTILDTDTNYTYVVHVDFYNAHEEYFTKAQNLQLLEQNPIERSVNIWDNKENGND